jgi:hypothetical protein
MVVAIEKAEYKGDYIINLQFSDGFERILILGDFCKKQRIMTDKNSFSSFTIDYGDLMWNDYEMCFPVWDLHEGKI